MAKHPKPSSSTKATPRPVDPAQDVETQDLERLKAFFVENRYYFFLATLVVGVVLGVWYWDRHTESQKAEKVARDLASTRQSPLKGEDLESETSALQKVSASGGRFFETDVAKESAESLEAIVKEAKGTSMEPWARYHLANRHYAAGEYDKAIAEYEALLGSLDGEHLLMAGEYIKNDLARAKAERDYAGTKPPELAPLPSGGPRVRVETTAGSFVVELAARGADDLVANFQGLVRSHYYDGLELYESDRVAFQEGRTNEPFAIGTGSPSGDRVGGPGYSQPKANLDVKIEEGMVLLDNEKDDASGGRIWFVREKDGGEDPGEIEDVLEQAGITGRDAAIGLAIADLERYGPYLQYDERLRKQYEELTTKASPEALQVPAIARDWQERKGQYLTFSEKIDGWRLARANIVQGKYSVLGRVVEGLDVLAKLEPGKDFILRMEPVDAKASPGRAD